jgi:hypothetical protein
VTPEDIHIHIHLHEDDPDLMARLATLEETVADQVTELTALRDQVTEFVEDLNARIEALEAAQGQFTPEAEAILAPLKAGLQAAVDRVGDADADGNPTPILPPPPPPEPEPTP